MKQRYNGIKLLQNLADERRKKPTPLEIGLRKPKPTTHVFFLFFFNVQTGFWKPVPWGLCFFWKLLIVLCLTEGHFVAKEWRGKAQLKESPEVSALMNSFKLEYSADGSHLWELCIKPKSCTFPPPFPSRPCSLNQVHAIRQELIQQALKASPSDSDKACRFDQNLFSTHFGRFPHKKAVCHVVKLISSA